jgi:peroxiredoxin
VAPSFALDSTSGQPVSLSEFSGRPVVLVFYPGDWTPVCRGQLSLYSQALAAFEEYRAVVLGISVDSVSSHRAFSDAVKLGFPLLADFEPKGHVARLYGAYDQARGTARRALFVVDAGGTIAWSDLSPEDLSPGADGILDALARLAGGK